MPTIVGSEAFSMEAGVSVRLFFILVLALNCIVAAESDDLAKSLGISFPGDKPSTIVLQRDGKSYLIDAAAHTVRETDAGAAPGVSSGANGQQLFSQNCVSCHGPEGKGK